jgi:hypothetical protein
MAPKSDRTWYEDDEPISSEQPGFFTVRWFDVLILAGALACLGVAIYRMNG